MKREYFAVYRVYDTCLVCSFSTIKQQQQSYSITVIVVEWRGKFCLVFCFLHVVDCAWCSFSDRTVDIAVVGRRAPFRIIYR